MYYDHYYYYYYYYYYYHHYYYHHHSPGDPLAHKGERKPLQPPRAHSPTEISVVPVDAVCL